MRRVRRDHQSEKNTVTIFTQTEAASRGGMSIPTYTPSFGPSKGPDRIRFGRAYVVTEQALNDWIDRLRSSRR